MIVPFAPVIHCPVRQFASAVVTQVNRAAQPFVELPISCHPKKLHFKVAPTIASANGSSQLPMRPVPIIAEMPPMLPGFSGSSASIKQCKGDSDADRGRPTKLGDANSEPTGAPGPAAVLPGGAAVPVRPDSGTVVGWPEGLAETRAGPATGALTRPTRNATHARFTDAAQLATRIPFRLQCVRL